MEEVAPVAKKNSPTGNRTRAFHVTGGDTHHYTIEEAMQESIKWGHPRLPRHFSGLEYALKENGRRTKILRAGFEPATYGCLMCDPTTVHRSTN